jgi:hypothetical protein
MDGPACPVCVIWEDADCRGWWEDSDIHFRAAAAVLGREVS